MAQNIDFAPTILDITNTPIPAEYGGEKVWFLWLQESRQALTSRIYTIIITNTQEIIR